MRLLLLKPFAVLLIALLGLGVGISGVSQRDSSTAPPGIIVKAPQESAITVGTWMDRPSYATGEAYAEFVHFEVNQPAYIVATHIDPSGVVRLLFKSDFKVEAGEYALPPQLFPMPLAEGEAFVQVLATPILIAIEELIQEDSREETFPILGDDPAEVKSRIERLIQGDHGLPAGAWGTAWTRYEIVRRGITPISGHGSCGYLVVEGIDRRNPSRLIDIDIWVNDVYMGINSDLEKICLRPGEIYTVEVEPHADYDKEDFKSSRVCIVNGEEKDPCEVSVPEGRTKVVTFELERKQPDRPFAAFTVGATVGTVAPTLGEPVQFDASESSCPSPTRIQSYEWQFGDGSSTATGVTTTHIYQSEGTYEVRLFITCTDDRGDDTGRLVHVPPVITPHSTQPINPPCVVVELGDFEANIEQGIGAITFKGRNGFTQIYWKELRGLEYFTEFKISFEYKVDEAPSYSYATASKNRNFTALSYVLVTFYDDEGATITSRRFFSIEKARGYSPRQYPRDRDIGEWKTLPVEVTLPKSAVRLEVSIVVDVAENDSEKGFDITYRIPE